MYDAMPASPDATSTSRQSSSESDLGYEDDDGTSIDEHGHDEDAAQSQDENIPGRPASRRSSIFGDRPVDPHIETNKATVLLAQRRSDSFRSKAMTMLRRIGGNNPSVDEAHQSVSHREYESWFELDGQNTKRKRSQGTFRQLFAANSFKTGDTNVACSQPSMAKLSRRKSILGLLRPSPSNSNSEAMSTAHDPSKATKTLIAPTKLTRRHSISRLFGGGSTTKDRRKNVQGQLAEMTAGGPDACNGAANLSAAMPAPRPESPVSLVSNASTVRPLRRQSSFFRRSNFSVNHSQHHASSSCPPNEEGHENPSSARRSDSLETPPENDLCSSPVPRSSDSLSTEDGLQSPVQLSVPAIVIQRCDDGEIDLIDENFLPKDVEDGPFGMRHCNGAVHRTVVVDSPPMLDLAVRLNSLSLDTLAFDPDAFEDAIDDDP